MSSVILYNCIKLLLFLPQLWNYVSAFNYDHRNDDDALPKFALRKLINYPFPKIGNSREVKLPCPPNTIGVVCAEDCLTLNVCIGELEPYANVTCAIESKDKPYCVQGECTSVAPQNTNCLSNSLCTSKGTFPDSKDCTKYHICDGPMSQPITHQCPPSYTYISSDKICQRTSKCQRFICPTVDGQIVAYKHDRAYYGLCFQNEITIYKCKDEIDYIYDETIKGCTFKCRYIGNHADRSNCNGYISCFYVNGKLNYKHLPCPVGYFFNSRLLKCEQEITKCINILQPTADTNPTLSVMRIQNDDRHDTEQNNLMGLISPTLTLV